MSGRKLDVGLLNSDLHPRNEELRALKPPSTPSSSPPPPLPPPTTTQPAMLLPPQRNTRPASLTLTFLLPLALTLPARGVGSGSSSGGQEDSGCPPGVACQHGYCPAGTVSCVCDEGWAGFQCERECPPDCLHNGACQTTPEGMAYCYCGDPDLHYVAGQGCVSLQDTTTTTTTTTTITTPATTTTTTATATASEEGMMSQTVFPSFNSTLLDNMTSQLPPLSERTCGETGLVCVHGRCAKNGNLGCDCEENWSGALCQEFCPLNCSLHGRCLVVGDGRYKCVCDSSHTGELCDQDKNFSSPLPPYHTNTSLDTTTQPAKRECVPGFVCVHGRCQDDAIKCVCEPGYVGEFCHQLCPVACVHGQCIVTGNSTALCACQPKYTGANCSELRTLPERNATGETTDRGLVTVSWGDLSSLKPISDRECVPGFVCVHGRCQDNAIKCICDPGYVGELCHQRCSMKCVHGECLVKPNGSVMCSCQPEYTGDHCSELRKLPELEEEDLTVQWYVVGACAGLMLLLLVLLVALPYWMWKRGHILVMKIVYHFKAFEDDDQKRYDAFISYSNVDEGFVMQQLFPKLTALSFSVCVHRKDFIPGETIANNIVEAVENSRRTILVLTPHFLRSQFCRFEYQQAQYQMIQHKHRIVPIVLQDVSQEKRNMDASLRSILNTITYLDWPLDDDPRQLDKFWKRLELSMPKRKSKPESPAGGKESALYSRLDSASSGYSSASSCSTTRSVSSSFTSSSSPLPVSPEPSPGPSSRVKKSGSISGQSTSSSSRGSRQSKHSSSRNNRRASRSTSRSKSRSRTVRPESVVVMVDMEQEREKGTGRRQEFMNPAYAMP